jgi:hypothetical protein
MPYVQLYYFIPESIHGLRYQFIILNFIPKLIIPKIYLKLYKLEIRSQNLIIGVYYNVSRIYNPKDILSHGIIPKCFTAVHSNSQEH